MAKIAPRMVKSQFKCKNMSEDIKKKYYKLNKDELDSYIDNLKDDPRNVTFLSGLRKTISLFCLWS